MADNNSNENKPFGFVIKDTNGWVSSSEFLTFEQWAEKLQYMHLPGGAMFEQRVLPTAYIEFKAFALENGIQVPKQINVTGTRNLSAAQVTVIFLVLAYIGEVQTAKFLAGMEDLPFPDFKEKNIKSLLMYPKEKVVFKGLNFKR